MDDVVFLSAARTPIGSFQGELKSLSAPQLGTEALKAAMHRADVQPEQIEQVLLRDFVVTGG